MCFPLVEFVYRPGSLAWPRGWAQHGTDISLIFPKPHYNSPTDEHSHCWGKLREKDIYGFKAQFQGKRL